MNQPKIVGLCAVCEIPVCSAKHKPPAGAWYDKHKGRGLCGACYGLHRRGGTLGRFPRTTRIRSVIYEQWLELKEMGVKPRDAATQLGMSYGAFDRTRHHEAALRRAKEQDMNKNDSQLNNTENTVEGSVEGAVVQVAGSGKVRNTVRGNVKGSVVQVAGDIHGGVHMNVSN